MPSVSTHKAPQAEPGQGRDAVLRKGVGDSVWHPGTQPRCLIKKRKKKAPEEAGSESTQVGAASGPALTRPRPLRLEDLTARSLCCLKFTW